jgi:hypothetical protein
VIHHLKLILTVESSFFMLITLTPRRLEVTLELLLCVVSLRKFVLLIVVIVSRLRSSW